MKAAFFVNEEALRRVQPDVRLDETGLLGPVQWVKIANQMRNY
jgi:hypothetical protein